MAYLSFHLGSLHGCECISSCRAAAAGTAVSTGRWFSNGRLAVPPSPLTLGSCSNDVVQGLSLHKLLGSSSIINSIRPREQGRAAGMKKAHAAAAAAAAAPQENSIISLVLAVAIPLLAGVVDALINNPNTPFYRKLKKPSWNPPDWAFGVAWGILYPVMGVASWLVWREGGWQQQSYALSLYVAQLILNLLWPALFFGAKSIGFALLDILALAGAIVVCIKTFAPINLVAAKLFIPYLAWVVFATVLNYSYYQLNKQQGGSGGALVSPAV